MMAPLFWLLTGEYSEVFAALGSNSGNWFQMSALLAVSLSCVFGLLISFFGFGARKAVSATAFTVTGVVNKFLTVVINAMIWDKHATPFGLVCLLFTLAGGVLYQQSVIRGGSAPPQRESTAHKETDSEFEADDLEEGEGKGTTDKLVSI
ncbi:GDP-mannose transporter GONST4 [Tripterygium wilfordii]|uniref:GDP-mannose transporter GONST4 n=1 Tax=Tripterygium wilfordii TaxID=458696 RepID=A0A7J7D6M0_TRIWF|nr:GDP-mannose transporter GONST4 [Tripterygium wilfordii]